KCGRDIEKRPIFHAGFYFAEAAIARSADAAIVEHENRRTARPEIAREMLVVARRNSSAADDQHGGRCPTRRCRLEPCARESNPVRGAKSRRSLGDCLQACGLQCGPFVATSAQWRISEVRRRADSHFADLASSNT